MRRNQFRSVFIFISLFLLLLQSTPARQQVAQVYQQRELRATQAIQAKLRNYRDRIRKNKYTFQVGYTRAMDYPLAKITGLKLPKDLSTIVGKQKIAVKALLDRKPVSEEKAVGYSATDRTFDWRKNGGATPVRDQDGCGSCWAFSTHGAFEGSYRIINNKSIDTSEQDTLDCNLLGYGCDGGWWAFQYLIDPGSAKESAYPYTGTKELCQKKKPRPYRAIAWDYVSTNPMPSVSELKQALCKHGPLAAAVEVTDLFQAYTGGVFNEGAKWQSATSFSAGDLVKSSSGDLIFTCIVAGTSGSAEPTWPTPQNPGDLPVVVDGGVTWQYVGVINHGITMIGWDDDKGAWLIKNSWGTEWGETGGYGTDKGYMWISYECNNIGYSAAWVTAKKNGKGCD